MLLSAISSDGKELVYICKLSDEYKKVNAIKIWMKPPHNLTNILNIILIITPFFRYYYSGID